MFYFAVSMWHNNCIKLSKKKCKRLFEYKNIFSCKGHLVELLVDHSRREKNGHDWIYKLTKKSRKRKQTCWIFFNSRRLLYSPIWRTTYIMNRVWSKCSWMKTFGHGRYLIFSYKKNSVCIYYDFCSQTQVLQ